MNAPCVTEEDILLLTNVADWYDTGPLYGREFGEGFARIARALRAVLAAVSQPPSPNVPSQTQAMVDALLAPVEDEERANRRELYANGWFESDRGWVNTQSATREPLSLSDALRAQREEGAGK